MPLPLLRLRWPLPRPPGSPRLLIMASIGSLLPSPWLPPRSTRFPPMVATSRPRCFRLCARAEREGIHGENPPPSSEKKSFALATGELFLGLASLLLRRGPGSPTLSVPTAEQKVLVPKKGVDEEVLYFSDRGEAIATAVEDRVDQEVIWEQRPEDVEAENKRKKVTSPGFSFSAAGLLFPYHLGVSQLLLEKGYITETTPLSGSSAGAIVCAVIASGNTMQDALKVTKLLAEDCRSNGTAFRLGVSAVSGGLKRGVK
ncbi:hypothetical protein Taro_023751 [Colocasia esculenta]|uniref:PNPLA domain-containing protein n=1 Tax=Colocasia esculenta TaxID=4460 RepID=A0A843VCC9_COLES|nr:hypothetical protein [Colocasia esculenta]